MTLLLKRPQAMETPQEVERRRLEEQRQRSAGWGMFILFWGGLFGGCVIGVQIGFPGLGLILGPGLFIICLLIYRADNQTRLEEEKQRVRRENAEREQQRNSPEEIERRRLEEERRRAEAEDRERLREAEKERRAREKWAEYHQYMRIEEVDAMGGRQFEQFIKALLERLSFTNVFETAASGDQGGDLTCVSPEKKKAVVQAKRWKGKVGNGAIQEVLGAMLFYGAEVGYVVTNSWFTDAAKALAQMDPRIFLIDRATLELMVSAAFPREVPDFDWVKYNEYVKNWRRG